MDRSSSQDRHSPQQLFTATQIEAVWRVPPDEVDRLVASGLLVTHPNPRRRRVPLYDAPEVDRLLEPSKARRRRPTPPVPGGAAGPKGAAAVRRLPLGVQPHPTGNLDLARLNFHAAAGYLGLTDDELMAVPHRELPFTRILRTPLYLVRDLAAYEQRSRDQ